jgi:hypothetical protein
LAAIPETLFSDSGLPKAGKDFYFAASGEVITMPSRVRKKAEKGPRNVKRSSAKPLRKLNFQNEPWYAEAARRLSAVRRSSDAALVPVAAPPLASE